ncbi:MAG TPA: outer membrane lipoprotein-sorting protein [candidate division Zixibacteria bacterium]|nr:outer membrane lipoprotein-sorting protein [candidate division Zixibacteria bacterium]
MIRIWTTTGLVVLLCVVAVRAQLKKSGDPLVDSLVNEVDRLYRSSSSYAEMEMEIVTPHWQRTLKMDAWSEGMDKTFIRINEPLKEKGVTTLRIDNEMWNYLPKTDKVMKIPPSMMMGSWMGSDFTNDDLVKESSFFDDYSYELIPSDSGDENLYYINCIPRPDLAVVWGNIVIGVEKDTRLPVWQRYYDEKKELMRVMTYSDVRTFDGRTLPATMAMVPTTKEGHKTVIRYTVAKFDIKLDKDIFSLRNLQSGQ